LAAATQETRRFAYAKKHVAEYFDNHHNDPVVCAAAEELAVEVGSCETLDTPEGAHTGCTIQMQHLVRYARGHECTILTLVDR